MPSPDQIDIAAQVPAGMCVFMYPPIEQSEKTNQGNLLLLIDSGNRSMLSQYHDNSI